MNREIKFRAWDMYRGEKGIMLSNHTFESIGITKLYNSHHLIWMQFTSLEDINGKEIYEGDILKCRNGEVFTVSFLIGHFIGSAHPDNETRGYLDCGNFHNTEVIGNIFQNPELIS